MVALDLLAATLIAVGLAFFVAGTVGLLRFPDVFTRLHAVTKADNVGLGFVVFGLSIQAESGWEVVELLLVWVLVMLASTTAAHLISANALSQGFPVGEEPS